MSTQFEIVVYIKTHTDREEVARDVFGALGGGEYVSDNEPALGGEYYRLVALGLDGTVFANEGDMEDEDFADYPVGLSISSTHVDPDLELAPVEAALSDYYARLLAFSLDVEVATSFYLGGQNGVDVYEIRAFKRNPQYTLDTGPTAQRVYITERRTVEYDAEAVEEGYAEGTEAELEEEAPLEDE
jgi:hypothetical protein